MAHIHREPYITVAGVTAERVLIAWGAFFFDVSGDAIDGRFKLVEDKDLKHVNPPRSTSIGESSSDYGPAEVRVWEKGSDPAAWLLSWGQKKPRLDPSAWVVPLLRRTE